MVEFGIWVVRPPQFPHSAAYEEVALALRDGFAALGRSAAIVEPPAAAKRLIVLGGQLIDPSLFAQLPVDTVIFNLEQIFDGSPWLEPHYLELLRRFEIWDYSRRNIETLARLGVARCRLCGIGYEPSLTRIEPGVEDIDVLHYGGMNAHRRAVLERLARSGLKVHHVFGVYGAERDRLIQRARIVLNIHLYEGRVFEIVRVSYLLANRRFVVSETGSDAELERPFHGGVDFAPHGELAERCLSRLADPAGRAQVAERGFRQFAQMRQSDMLRALLAEEPPAHR